jgi:hypothetical protein
MTWLVYFASALLCATVITAAAGVPQYPVDASWFANRWSLDEWLVALSAFQAQGGSAVWQRGANFRRRVGGAEELKNDPDWIWCWALENCLDAAVSDVKARGLTVANWFTYWNEEQYDDAALLRCDLDRKINSSRVYHRLVVPHGRFSADWDCSFAPGEKVDVIFTIFNGIDPHALLLQAADKLGMEVYLPMPAIPDPVDQRPAFYEFTKRVIDSYERRFGSLRSYRGYY